MRCLYTTLFASLTVFTLACCGDGSGGGPNGVVDSGPNDSDANPNAPDSGPEVPTCLDTPSLNLCDDSCVDLQSDSEHCGDCDSPCGATQACVTGGCVSGVSSLVLSEVHAQSPSFFEIYNGSSDEIALSGYQIQWNTDNVETGALVLPALTIAPGQFITLLEGNGQNSDNEIFLSSELGWEKSIALRLLAPGGLGVDFVRTGVSITEPPTGTIWTGDSADNPSHTVGQSLIRNVFSADSDSNADWSLEGPSSPGSYCPLGEGCGDSCPELLSDILNCGACGVQCGSTESCIGGTCQDAFVGLWISEYKRYGRAGVELHNPTAAPINMSNYRLDLSGGPDNLTYTFPQFTLQAGAFVFLYVGEGTNTDNTLYLGSTGSLGPNLAIALYDNGTTALDFIRIGTSEAPAPANTSWFGRNLEVPDNGHNVSLRRNIQTFDTDGAADWRENVTATPGFACYEGLNICDGLCVSLAEDDNDCGACDNACAGNESCIAGQCSTVGSVVISELRNVGSEYFELYNGGNSEVDISGWQLQWVADSGGPGLFTIPDGTSLSSGEFLSFSESSGSSTGSQIRMGESINWSTSIALAVLDSQGVGIDFVRSADSVTMPPTGTTWTGAAASNPQDTLVRAIYSVDTDTSADWQERPTGSEGRFCALVVASECEGECVLLSTDVNNCGACGNTCPSGSQCHDSQCIDQGMVRINNANQGRLDLFQDNTWRRVSPSSFTDIHASIACRQLGFASGTDENTNSGANCVDCQGTLYSFSCSGEESLLMSCPHITSNNSGSSVKVECQ